MDTTIEKLFAAGERLMKEMALECLVITRGRDGMVAFEKNAEPAAIPIYGSDQVVDVTGAGDTVIATFTAALAAGADTASAARLANFAGGIVVMKRGTATVSGKELLAAIDQLLCGDTARERKQVRSEDSFRATPCASAWRNGDALASRSCWRMAASTCCTSGTFAICAGPRRLAGSWSSP